MAFTHLHTCMLCEAVCGIRLEVEGDRIVSVRGDEDDPFSRGHICPKAAAIPDVVEDPDRIREPMRRVGERWMPVSWDQALDEAAERLARVQKQHGRSAVALFLGNPTAHSYSALLAAPLFARLLGSRARFSATSVDQLPHMLASLEMLGHQLLLPVPDVDRTAFFLVLGANPVASNGSLMTAPGIAARLKALRDRGGRLVVVDPRRTETAALADTHLPIRPGTDALLLLAVLHVVLGEGLASPGRLADFTDGIDELGRIAARFAPERIAGRTGIEAAAIRRLARDFAAAPSAVCYGRVGACTQPFGGVTAWLVNALNVVTGNLDRPGGAMFATPAIDLVRLPAVAHRGHWALWGSRVRGLPEFGGELPAAAMAEEMETPGEGQIRGLVTFAGNPVLSTPNGARLERLLAGLDFMVSIDIYRNETTRHAHLILPTSFGPERDHYDVGFYLLAVRNVARYVRAAIPPPAGVRDDGDVLLDLALRLHGHGGGRRGARLAWTVRAVRRLGVRRVLDLLLRLGPYGLRRLGRGALSLGALERSPHGIDLGPLETRLPRLLRTRRRRIVLVPESFARDLPRLESTLEVAGGEGGLLLVGRRQLRSNNSWMHNSLKLVKGPERCTLLMHPDDARGRGIIDGQRVQLRSRTGAIEVPVEITGEIARGVVSLPHGWGHHRAGTALGVARAHAGASLNDVTDELAVDPVSGTAALSALPVEVTIRQ